MIKDNEENKIYKAELTDKEKELLSYIENEWYETGGYTPSYRDICRALDISTTSVVFKMMNKLEKQGYIKKISGAKKGVRKNIRRYELLGSKLKLDKTETSFYKNAEDKYNIQSVNIAKVPLLKNRVEMFEYDIESENNNRDNTYDEEDNIKNKILHEDNMEEYVAVPVEYGKQHEMIAFINPINRYKDEGMKKDDLIIVDMKYKYIARDFIARYNPTLKRLEVHRYQRGESRRNIVGKVIGSYSTITY